MVLAWEATHACVSPGLLSLSLALSLNWPHSSVSMHRSDSRHPTVPLLTTWLLCPFSLESVYRNVLLCLSLWPWLALCASLTMSLILSLQTFLPHHRHACFSPISGCFRGLRLSGHMWCPRGFICSGEIDSVSAEEAGPHDSMQRDLHVLKICLCA